MTAADALSVCRRTIAEDARDARPVSILIKTSRRSWSFAGPDVASVLSQFDKAIQAEKDLLVP